METGAYRELNRKYEEKRSRLQRSFDTKLKLLAEAHRRETAAMRAQCIKEHGSHDDDGAMFSGMCGRCGFL